MKSGTWKSVSIIAGLFCAIAIALSLVVVNNIRESIDRFYFHDHAAPETKFRALFGDLSVGIPDYQTVSGFTQPEDSAKGDFCTVDFSQSETQFAAFVGRLRVSQSNVLSSDGVKVRADSKLNPKYPWMLLIHADTNAPDGIYHVHIDGHQAYN